MPDKEKTDSRNLKLIFFGDVVGKPGRKALKKVLPEIREQYHPDFVVVNVENIAHGKGVTLNALSDLSDLQIDVFTSGNHAFDKGEMSKEAFEQTPNLIRPANYVGDFPGKGWVRIEKDDQGYLIINLNAQVFFEKQFPGQIGSPFTEFDTIMTDHARSSDIVFLDFHSEATSEKRAMGYYADGRATLVCGTHTHVPTADLQILPKGTGYISDVGMIGPLNSVLGVPIENSLEIFRGGKFVYDVEENGPVMVNAIYIEISPLAPRRALKVEKIYKVIEI